ncbi:hypothetical protein TNCV_2383621 [Trichonephila clavipes]|nr:hypothetical protein TNCV_2383621 [Trichonephila clavipes]
MTPELVTPSPNYHTNGRTFQLSTDLACIAALHGGSLVWYWARTHDKSSQDPIPIPLGNRGRSTFWEFDVNALRLVVLRF